MIAVGILVFDEVEVLDFAGPFEVFSTASRLNERAGNPRAFRVLTIAKTAPVVARGGLCIEPHHQLEDHPALDVVIVPGGDVSALQRDGKVLRWLSRVEKSAMVTASICTGAFLLAAAGLLGGKRATTHFEDIDDFRRSFPRVSVEEGVRWIDEGRFMTSAGIAAGIDMSLHLVGRLAGEELAKMTARQMDYPWTSGDA